MFDEYESEVLKSYHDKKDEGVFSTNLSHPTPAKLKKECIAVFDRRHQKKDEVILRSFFGEGAEIDAYRLTIKKWETDKFRPLNMVLRGEGIKTDPKNIELLAWLINFQPRPYAAWLKGQSHEVNDISSVVGEEEEINHGQKIKSGQTKEFEPYVLDSVKPQRASLTWRRNQLILSAIVVIAIGMAIYLFFNRHRLTGQEKCMYWAGDHYQPISCSAKPSDTTIAVLGLDSAKLLHFKRITSPDTLTANSAGKVWYVKVNGGLEYYTAPGEHPLYPEKRLLPLTTYILNKYPRNGN